MFKDVLIIDLEVCNHCKTERKNRVFDNLCDDLYLKFIAYMTWKLRGTEPKLSQFKALQTQLERNSEFKDRFNYILLSEVPSLNIENRIKQSER